MEFLMVRELGSVGSGKFDVILRILEIVETLEFDNGSFKRESGESLKEEISKVECHDLFDKVMGDISEWVVNPPEGYELFKISCSEDHPKHDKLRENILAVASGTFSGLLMTEEDGFRDLNDYIKTKLLIDFESAWLNEDLYKELKEV